MIQSVRRHWHRRQKDGPGEFLIELMHTSMYGISHSVLTHVNAIESPGRQINVDLSTSP